MKVYCLSTVDDRCLAIVVWGPQAHQSGLSGRDLRLRITTDRELSQNRWRRSLLQPHTTITATILPFGDAPQHFGVFTCGAPTVFYREISCPDSARWRRIYKKRKRVSTLFPEESETTPNLQTLAESLNRYLQYPKAGADITGESAYGRRLVYVSIFPLPRYIHWQFGTE